MVFNKLNGIKHYFLCVTEVEQDLIIKFHLEPYWFCNLSILKAHLQIKRK
jgi:hypothetical protein